jgi:hypothetical protein
MTWLQRYATDAASPRAISFNIIYIIVITSLGNAPLPRRNPTNSSLALNAIDSVNTSDENRLPP